MGGSRRWVVTTDLVDVDTSGQFFLLNYRKVGNKNVCYFDLLCNHINAFILNIGKFFQRSLLVLFLAPTYQAKG